MMITCARCQGVNVSGGSFCVFCGYLLPQQATTDRNATRDSLQQGRIQCLLNEINSWQAQGILSADVCERLASPYRQQLKPISEPLPAPPVDIDLGQPEAPARPVDLREVTSRAASEEIPREKESARVTTSSIPSWPREERPAFEWMSVLEAFLEERNIFWWHIVSAIVLTTGLIGLAWWQWSLLGIYIVTSFFLGMTFALYRLGVVSLQRLPTNGRVLIAVSMLLVPLNVVFINANRVLGFHLEWDLTGLLTAIACCGLYALFLHRHKLEEMSYFAGFAALAAMHYALRLCGASLETERLFLIPAAMGFVAIAHSAKDSEAPVERPFNYLAHTTVGLTLASIVFFSSEDFFSPLARLSAPLKAAPRTLAHTLVTLLMSVAFYATMARIQKNLCFAHLALGLFAYSWLLASRLLSDLSERPPINIGLVFYPLTLGPALVGALAIRQGNDHRASLALPWVAVLSVVSLVGQLLGPGKVFDILISRVEAVGKFMRFASGGDVTVIGVFVLHAALFAFFANEFARTAEESNQRQEDPVAAGFSLRAFAQQAAPWLAVATAICLALALIQTIARLHLPVVTGSLTMIGFSAMLFSISVVTESAAQPWWSRPLFICSALCAAVFSLVPFVNPKTVDSPQTIAAMTSSILLASAMVVWLRAKHNTLASPKDPSRDMKPGGDWLVVAEDSVSAFAWTIVGWAVLLATMFINAKHWTLLAHGSYQLAAYSGICAICWIGLALRSEGSALFIAGLIAASIALLEFTIAILPIEKTLVGWYGLIAVAYAFVLLAATWTLKRVKRADFAVASQGFAEFFAVAGLFIPFLAYEATTNFALPGKTDEFSTERWLLFGTGIVTAVVVFITYTWQRAQARVYLIWTSLAIAYTALLQFPFAMPAVMRHLSNEANYGLFYLPLGILTLAFAMHRHNKDEVISTPLLHCSMAVLSLCLLLQPYYIYSTNFTLTPVISLLVLALISAFCALTVRRPELINVTTALATWGVCQWESNAGLSSAALSLTMATFAFLPFCLGESLAIRVPAWRAAFTNSAVGLACIAPLFAAYSAHSTGLTTSTGILSIVLLSAICLRQKVSVYCEIGAMSLLILCIGQLIGSGMASAPVPSAVGATAVFSAIIYLLLAFHFRKDLLATISGLFIGIAWITLALNDFTRTESLTLFALLALFGVAYGLFAHQQKSTAFGALGALCLTVSHAHMMQSLSIPWLYYPLLTVPLVVMLAMWPQQMPHLYQPFRLAAACIAAIALMHALYNDHRWVLLATLVVYGSLFFADAIDKHAREQAIVSAVLLSVAWAHFLRGFAFSELQHVFFLSQLALAWLAVTWFVSEREKQVGEVFSDTAAVVAGLVAISSVMMVSSDRGHGNYAILSLLISSASFAAFAGMRRQFWPVHLSFLCVLAAYYLPLIDRNVKAPDAYLIPVGLYLIALSLLSERIEPGAQRKEANLHFDSVGLFIAFGSSLWSSSTAIDSPWHDVVLTTEAAAAFAFGIAQRRRTFAVQGAGFLTALGIVKSWGILISIHWAIYATTLGILGLMIGYYFSLKREEVLAVSRRLKSELAAWR